MQKLTEKRLANEKKIQVLKGVFSGKNKTAAEEESFKESETSDSQESQSDADEDEDIISDEEDEEEAGPDLLLREAARIAADMAGFHRDMERLNDAVSQLRTEENSAEALN